MRITFLILGLLTSSGCATAPAQLCSVAGPAAALDPPPAHADALVADLAEQRPALLDPKRDHWVWLQSDTGALHLCTYQRAPVLTGTCGANVHIFEPQANGRFTYARTLISACH